MDPLIEIFGVIFGTKQWFASLDDYLERISSEIANGYPEALEELEERARTEGWEFHDFDAGRQALEGNFTYSFPRILAYSSISLTFSILEARLVAVANHLRERDSHDLKISDISGNALERAATYYQKVLGIPISEYPAWQHLKDLEFLRHRVVHRAGFVGEDPQLRKRIESVRGRIGELVQVDELLGPTMAELKIDLGACRHYVAQAHDFFDRLFNDSGLLTMKLRDPNAS
jgi:hypothetical protein